METGVGFALVLVHISHENLTWATPSERTGDYMDELLSRTVGRTNEVNTEGLGNPGGVGSKLA